MQACKVRPVADVVYSNGNYKRGAHSTNAADVEVTSGGSNRRESDSEVRACGRMACHPVPSQIEMHEAEAERRASFTSV